MVYEALKFVESVPGYQHLEAGKYNSGSSYTELSMVVNRETCVVVYES